MAAQAPSPRIFHTQTTLDCGPEDLEQQPWDDAWGSQVWAESSSFFGSDRGSEHAWQTAASAAPQPAAHHDADAAGAAAAAQRERAQALELEASRWRLACREVQDEAAGLQRQLAAASEAEQLASSEAAAMRRAVSELTASADRQAAEAAELAARLAAGADEAAALRARLAAAERDQERLEARNAALRRRVQELDAELERAAEQLQAARQEAAARRAEASRPAPPRVDAASPARSQPAACAAAVEALPAAGWAEPAQERARWGHRRLSEPGERPPLSELSQLAEPGADSSAAELQAAPHGEPPHAPPAAARSPFGTELTAQELAAGTEELERRLLGLSVERGALESEYARMPLSSAGRTRQERQRKAELEARLEAVGRERSAVRLQLKRLGVR